ncbi:MAG: Chaperone protein DnaJ [Candidatus Doudnabacteria bacterium]|nr:Chaperone protein DnaJ [Candidatus Doudnabacteria bacterium]
MAKNFYEILGVQKSASADDIKRAYRKLAGEHHPDRGGDSNRFKEINEAYQVLSDSTKRSQYDQYGQTFDQAQRQGGFGGGFNGAAGGNPFEGFGFEGGFGNAGGSFGFEDILSSMFGGDPESAERRNRGVDLEMPLTISFKEAAFGTETEITLEKKNRCERCEGSGAEPGSKLITCPKCHGQGQIKTTRRTILGTIASSAVCDRCEGSGKIPEIPCTECKGEGVKRGRKTIKISIPAGIDNGQRIRVKGEGEAGYRGSATGDLYISIRVTPDPQFRREGSDIYKDADISYSQAALGTTIETNTIDGTVKIKIPNGTQPGKVFKVADKGVPHLNRSGRGNMYVTVNIKVPEKLSKKQKELLKQLEEVE